MMTNDDKSRQKPTFYFLSLLAGFCLLAPATAGAVEVERVVSPMGIEAWLVENESIPVISMEFAFLGGTATDPEGKAGRANLVSVLLDEGAGDLDSQEFQGRLSDSAISLSFDAGPDAFFGSLQTVSRFSGEAFELLRLAINEPRFDEEPVERMRAAVAASIRQQTGDPGWLSRRAFYDLAYPDHPYGDPSRGTIETLNNLTVEDLRTFVEERLARDNLLIGVTGDISAEELAPVLDDVFGGLPAESAPFEIPAVEMRGQGQTVLVEREGPQSVLLMAQPGISRDDPDYYPALVMNFILGGGGFESRLTHELRAERGLTYGVSSYLVENEKTTMLMLDTSLTNQNVATAIDLIRQEWRRMEEEGATQEEVDGAKTYMTGSFPLAFTSTDRIAGTLLFMQLHDLGIDYIDTRNEKVEAVTLEQVNAVAERLLDPAALATVVVGDPAEEISPDITRQAADIVAHELGRGGS